MYPQHMFWLRNKKIHFEYTLLTKSLCDKDQNLMFGSGSFHGECLFHNEIRKNIINTDWGKNYIINEFLILEKWKD